MENEIRMEEAKKNVIRIAWALIAINALALHDAASAGFGQQFLPSPLRGIINSGMAGTLGLPAHLSIFAILKMALSIAIIYFSVQMMRFSDNGRNIISKLLIVDVFFVFVTVIISFVSFFSFGYFSGMPYFVNYNLILLSIATLLYNGAAIVMYYLFYRFLNKADTKAVFSGNTIQD